MVTGEVAALVSQPWHDTQCWWSLQKGTWRSAVTNSVLQKGRFHHTPTIKQKPCSGVGEIWVSRSVGAHHTENQFSSALQGMESIRDIPNQLLGLASCCHSLSTSTACSRFSPTEAWSQNVCQLLCSESNLQLVSHLQLPERRRWIEHT